MSTTQNLEFDFRTFDPRGYLYQYYSVVDFENDQLLQFFAESYEEAQFGSDLLEFGGGPTIYSLITAATKVSTIHFCDMLESNLCEVQSWKKGVEDAFNWDPFIKRALEIEGNYGAYTNLQQRANLLREKLTKFSLCDAFSKQPLGKENFHTCDILQVNFVPESITSSHEKWEEATMNILSLLKPQGTLLLTALKNAYYYDLGGMRFPATNITEVDLIGLLVKFGFKEEDMRIRAIAANAPYRGYDGMIFLQAERSIK